MNDENFGSYFQSIRKSKNITQEEIANSVNKVKMTISQIENNKNEPPNGKFLKELIDSLSLSDEKQKRKLYFLASKQRKTLPIDIEEYFFSNEEIYNTIIRAMQKDKKDRDWKEIFK